MNAIRGAAKTAAELSVKTARRAGSLGASLGTGLAKGLPVSAFKKAAMKQTDDVFAGAGKAAVKQAGDVASAGKAAADDVVGAGLKTTGDLAGAGKGAGKSIDDTGALFKQADNVGAAKNSKRLSALEAAQGAAMIGLGGYVTYRFASRSAAQQDCIAKCLPPNWDEYVQSRDAPTRVPVQYHDDETDDQPRCTEDWRSTWLSDWGDWQDGDDCEKYCEKKCEEAHPATLGHALNDAVGGAASAVGGFGCTILFGMSCQDVLNRLAAIVGVLVLVYFVLLPMLRAKATSLVETESSSSVVFMPAPNMAQTPGPG